LKLFFREIFDSPGSFESNGTPSIACRNGQTLPVKQEAGRVCELLRLAVLGAEIAVSLSNAKYN